MHSIMLEMTDFWKACNIMQRFISQKNKSKIEVEFPGMLCPL